VQLVAFKEFKVGVWPVAGIIPQFSAAVVTALPLAMASRGSWDGDPMHNVKAGDLLP